MIARRFFRSLLNCAAGMNNNCRCAKVYGLLGLAAKKGVVVSGGNACERALKYTVGGIMILAADASGNTKAKFIRLSITKNIPYMVFGSRSELGRRVGTGERSVMVLTDQGFARAIRVLLGFSDDENGGVKFG